MLVCAISCLTVLLSIMGVASPIISFMAFLCVYFMPGWALVSALFPGRTANLGRLTKADTSDSEISLLERLVVSVVLSLLVFAIGSISLAWSPGEFDEGVLLAEVLLLNVGFAALAMYRRFQLPRDQEFELSFEIGTKVGPYSSAEKAVIGIVSVACVAAVLIAAGVLGGGVAPEPHTEFFITGPDGSLGSLPQTLAVGKNGTVLLNFVNKMGAEQRYDLLVGVMANGTYLNRTAIDWTAVHTLIPGDAFEANETLRDGQKFSSGMVIDFESEGVYQVMFQLDFGAEQELLWLYVTVS